MLARSGSVLLTGGTGFVGSYLAAELVRQGRFVVFLARGTDQRSARERVDDLMRWHGQVDPTGYAVQDGELTSPRFGLAASDYSVLARTCQEIWHCASDTSFSEKKRADLERVNVRGSHQIARFAADTRPDMLNYISTSYAVGKVAGRCEEAFFPQAEFHNPYEQTKHAAEWLLKRECDRRSIPLMVYRPSIIIGEADNGRSLAFKGMYYPLKMLDYFRTTFLHDLSATGGENARQVGARLDGDGTLVLPLRLVTGGDGDRAVNLVPIDFVVDGCMRIRAEGKPGEVYHLVSDRPMPLGTLIESAQRTLGITGVSIAGPGDLAGRPETALERRFRALLAIYLPYLRDDRQFLAENTRAVLRDSGISCPEVGTPILARCISYAQQVGWTAPR